MAENLEKKGENLMADLVKDIEGKLPTIERLKQMNKLAAEIGEKDVELENVIESAESFAHMIIDRFGKKKIQK